MYGPNTPFTLGYGEPKLFEGLDEIRIIKNKSLYSEIFIKRHSQQISPASQAIVAPHIKSRRNSEKQVCLLRESLGIAQPPLQIQA